MAMVSVPWFTGLTGTKQIPIICAMVVGAVVDIVMALGLASCCCVLLFFLRVVGDNGSGSFVGGSGSVPVTVPVG
jgi:hypothetical protein